MRAAWLCACAAAIGCAGDEGPKVALTPPAYATRMSAAVCADLSRCCTAQERAFAPSLEAGCDGAEFDAHARARAIERGLAHGGLEYHPERAAACAAAAEAGSCATFARALQARGAYLADCAGITTPLVATGDPCVVHEECMQGRCGESGVCEGTIGPCTLDPCPDDQRCEPLDPMTRRCIPLTADGEPCTESDGCASALCHEGVCRPWPWCNGDPSDDLRFPLAVCDTRVAELPQGRASRCVLTSTGPLSCDCYTDAVLTSTCRASTATVATREEPCLGACCPR